MQGFASQAERALTLGLADWPARSRWRNPTQAWRISQMQHWAPPSACAGDAARTGKGIGGTERAVFPARHGKARRRRAHYSSDIDVIALFEPGAPGLRWS
jgi:hypothetical protein